MDFFHKHEGAASVEGIIDLLLHECVLAGLANTDDKGYRSAEVIGSFASVFVCVAGVAISDATFFSCHSFLHLILDFRLSFAAAFGSPNDPLPVKFLNPKAFISQFIFVSAPCVPERWGRRSYQSIEPDAEFGGLGAVLATRAERFVL